jgi:hypothetical protein
MSSGQQQNLTVLTDHIRQLTEKQQTAVDQISGANRSIVDPARNMRESHGLICTATNFAVSEAETVRKVAGGALLRVSTELAEKLTAAASAYENTDNSESGSIDSCGV